MERPPDAPPLSPEGRFPTGLMAGQDQVPVGGDAEWQALAFSGGEHRVALDLGGARLDFACGDASLASVLADLWRDFRGSGGEAQLAVSLRAVERLPFATPVAVAAHARRGGELLVKMRGLMARIDLARAAASALVERAFPEQDLGNLLRLLVSGAAPRAGAFLARGAALERVGRALLFLGPAHAGKSTIARLAAPRTALTDDCVLLAREAAIIEARTLGVRGMEGSEGLEVARAPRRLPVGGIFVLEKAPANRTERLPPGRAALALVSAIATLPGDREGAGAALGFAEALARELPVWRLEFHNRDASVMAVVEDAVAGYDAAVSTGKRG